MRATIVTVWQILFQKRGVLLGMLLLPALLTFVAIVGYDHDNNIPLTLGIHAEGEVPLSMSVIRDLEAKGYEIIRYKGLDLCHTRVRQGKIHSCVHLRKSGNREEAIFFVNPSELALADHLRTEIYEATQGPGAAVARNSTRALLGEVGRAREAASAIRPTVVDMTTQYQKISSEVGHFVDSLSVVTPALNMSGIGNDSVSGGHEALMSWIGEVGSYKGEIIGSYDKTLDEIKDELDDIAISETDRARLLDILFDGQNELDDISDEFRSSELVTRDKSDDFNAAIVDLIAQASVIEQDVKEFNKLKDESKYRASKVKTLVDESLFSVAEIQKSVNIIGDTVLELTGDDPDQVLAPIAASVATVGVQGTPFTFIFPNVLMLYLLLAGLSIGALVDVHYRMSVGDRRRKLTPSSPSVHRVGQILGVWSVVGAFGTIMVLVALFRLGIVLHALPFLLLGIWGSSFVAVLLGTLIGHFFDSEENAVLWSMGLSTFMILLSPLLRPIEHLPAGLHAIAQVNPLTCGINIMRTAIGAHSTHPESLGILIISSVCMLGVLLWHRR